MAKKMVTATAKRNCNIYFMKTPCGLSFDNRDIIKGQSIVLELVATEKVNNSSLISSILGDRYFVFKEGDHYVSAYSGDFELSNN